MTTITQLDPIETASRDELQALQTQRLKWTLKHAYENVPMYRRKFDAAGIHPDDFHELSDLSKFPCTTKQDLRDNYPFDTFAVPMEQVVRIHASSGTTGKPTVVGYTQNDIDNWANIVARLLRGKSFDITGKRRNLTGIRGITGFTLFGYLIPVKEKLSRSAKLLILLLKSLHRSKGGVQNQFYHTSK